MMLVYFHTRNLVIFLSNLARVVVSDTENKNASINYKEDFKWTIVDLYHHSGSSVTDPLANIASDVTIYA
ncbi:hypothetical protein ACDX78_12625 [Virgibacillus oceani]